MCDDDPLVEPGGPTDGQFSVAAALVNRHSPSPAAFIAVAREAAQAQRPRDTEVALIVACRLAAGAAPTPTVALADIEMLLGQHYFESAPGVASPQVRAQLLARAHKLLADSLGAYTAVLGPDASKTRLAGRRIAERAAAQSRIDSHADQVDWEQRSEPPESLRALGAAMGPPAGTLRPGCEKMPSRARQIICSEPELAQLDSDLQRLRNQAASVTPDREGLRRRAEQAQARRDASCLDKACLLRWYAQRRRELIGEFQGIARTLKP